MHSHTSVSHSLYTLHYRQLRDNTALQIIPEHNMIEYYTPEIIIKNIYIKQQLPSSHLLLHSPALLNHQIGNLRDSCELPQLNAAEPDLWDPATSIWAHPETPEMWPFLGTLDGLVGSPKSQFIPHTPICTERLWFLLLQYRVWEIQDGMVPGYLQATEAD